MTRHNYVCQSLCLYTGQVRHTHFTFQSGLYVCDPKVFLCPPPCNPYFRVTFINILTHLLFYYRSLRSLIVYVRRHRFMKFLAILLVLLILFKILEPNYFSYTISYFRIIINMVNTDIQRHQDVTRQEAEVAVSKNINWKYREGETVILYKALDW
jgi:hypothetical protein